MKSRAYGGVGDDDGALGGDRVAHRAVDAVARCSRRSCRSSPKRSGRGCATVRSTAPRGRPPTRLRLAGRRRRWCSRSRPRCSRRCARQKSEQKVSLIDAGRARSSCTTPPTGSPRSRRAEGDLCEAGKIAQLDSTADGAELACRGRARGARRRVILPGLRRAPGVARRARQPGDRRAARRQAASGARRRSNASRTLVAVPRVARSSSIPAIHLTGTNGKTTTTRMITRAARRGRARGRRVHEPAPRARQRAHRANDEPIDRRRARRACSARRRARRAASRARPVVLRDADRRPRCAGSPTKPSTSRCVEVGLGGTWDATNVDRRPTSRSSPTSASTTSSISAPTREQIAAEKAGIVKPRRARSCSARPIPISQAIFDATPTGAACSGATSTSASRAQRARGRRPARRSLQPSARAYPDVFVPLHGAHQGDNAAIALAAAEAFVGRAARRRCGARRRSRRCVRRAGSKSSAGIRSCCSTARTTSRARRRCARRSTRSSVPAPRTLVVGMLREREPPRCSTALGLDERRRLLVCAAPPNPRALDRPLIADRPRSSSAFPRSASRSSTRCPRRVSSRAARDARRRARSSITGSLYFVGAARGDAWSRNRGTPALWGRFDVVR